MKKSEYLMTSLVTRLNELLNGRHIDELDDVEFAMFQDRIRTLRLIADLYEHELTCLNKDGRYEFSFVSSDK